ncbi:rod shape-determining protein MreD [Myxococcota bacterium]
MRNVALLAVGLLLVLAQTFLPTLVLGPLGLVHGWNPSLLLPLVVFLGVHEPSMVRGALLAFLTGHALDLLAAEPIWIFTFVYVSIWWLARLAGVRLTAQTVLPRMLLAFVFALVEGGLVLILLAVFGSDTRRPVEIAQVVLPRAVSTALMAPWVFRLAQRLHPGTVAVRGGSEAVRA